MKTAIIFSGNIITTELIASMLKNKINHEVEIFDTSKTFYIDFSEFDNFIFGTNVRFDKLNPRFIRCIKKMKKYVNDNQNYFVYITGVRIEKAEDYIKKARKVVKDKICDYYFVGGELKTENCKGFNKFLVTKFINQYNNKNNESPNLIDENIDKLAESINNFNKE